MSSQRIRKVWIEEGCISCELCQDTAPDVFLVDNSEECTIRPDAARHFEPLAKDIEQAARDCPVEVIQLEHAGDSRAREPR
jgi:ferredoxin